MDKVTLYSLATGTVLFAGFVGAMERLYGRLVKWLRREFSPLVAGVKDDVAAMQADIERIKHELTTNGGGSLKDEVRAIRRDLDARHEQNAERLDLVDSRLEDIDDKLAQLGDAQKKLRRALLGHLRLGHRQAHTEEAQGIPDEVIEAIEDLDNDDERRGRRRNP